MHTVMRQYAVRMCGKFTTEDPVFLHEQTNNNCLCCNPHPASKAPKAFIIGQDTTNTLVCSVKLTAYVPLLCMCGRSS